MKEIVYKSISIAIGTVLAYIAIGLILAWMKKIKKEDPVTIVIDSKPLEVSPTQKRNDFLSMYKSNNIY
jgi:hypothetical protein